MLLETVPVWSRENWEDNVSVRNGEGSTQEPFRHKEPSVVKVCLCLNLINVMCVHLNKIYIFLHKKPKILTSSKMYILLFIREITLLSFHSIVLYLILFIECNNFIHLSLTVSYKIVSFLSPVCMLCIYS